MSAFDIFWTLLKTGALSFFIAGAVVFPLAFPYYMSRVVLSLGLVALMNGCESVLTLGHITMSSFLSGNTAEHSVRAYGFGIWVVLLVYAIWKQRNRPTPVESDFESTQ